MRAEKDGQFRAMEAWLLKVHSMTVRFVWWREAEARAPDGGDGRLLLQKLGPPTLRSLSQS